MNNENIEAKAKASENNGGGGLCRWNEKEENFGSRNINSDDNLDVYGSIFDDGKR